MAASGGKWFQLMVVLVCTVPISMDNSILHLAIPALAGALRATPDEVLWIIDIYALIQSGFLISMGVLGDRIGHKRLMVSGLLLFGIASTLAGFAGSALSLILARGLLGLGSAMIFPGTIAFVRLTFTDEKERAVAIGIWSAVSACGLALGPLAGGAMLTHYAWGTVFLINVPLMALAIPMMWRVMPNSPRNTSQPWQPLPAFALIAGTLAVIYVLKGFVRPGARFADEWPLLAIGIVLLVGFFWRQARAECPMLDLSLFRRPAIALGLLIAFVSMVAISGYELLFSQELQYVYGLTPLAAGTYLLPCAVALGVSGPLAGKVIAHTGARRAFTWGLLLAAAAYFGLALSHPVEQRLLTLCLLACVGMSIAGVLVASTAAIMGATPADKAGAAGSLEAMAYVTGIGLGVAVFGVLSTRLYTLHFVWPAGLSPQDVARMGFPPTQTIAETLDAARRLGRVDGPAGLALAASARTAFSSAHTVILSVAGGLLALLACVANRALR